MREKKKKERKGYFSYPEDSFHVAQVQTLSSLFHFPVHPEGNANMRLLPPTSRRTGCKSSPRCHGEDFFQVNKLTRGNRAIRVHGAITRKVKVILCNFLVSLISTKDLSSKQEIWCENAQLMLSKETDQKSACLNVPCSVKRDFC